MARDVVTIKALADRQAELHADQARLQAELKRERARITDLQADDERRACEFDRLRAELEQARRSWWWRLLR
jgi:hypothetical protein